jgi:hypothetical protein
MKKYCLTFLFAAACLGMFAQQVPRDKVCVEIGTGTWCQYCPGAAMGADDMIANGLQVAIMENHNGDAFANVYSNARNSYYGISGYPTAKFDGVLTYVGGSNTQSMYNNYLPKYNQRIVIPCNFTLAITGSASGNNYSVTITASKVAAYTGTNLVAHLSLTQSNIIYSWQGQTHLNFVNRLMVPSATGTALDFSSQSTQMINLNFTKDAAWPLADCELVVFIQDNSSKEVLQCIKVALPDLAPPLDYDASLTKISGMPVLSCTGTCNPVVTLKNAGGQTLTSASIVYAVNGGAPSSYSWSGSLATNQTAEVPLPAGSFTVLSSNSVQAYVSDPNGQPDQNHLNDTTETTFSQASTIMSVVTLELKTDNNPAQTTWTLKNSSGQLLYSGGPYANASTVYTETFNLADEDCYVFTILDAGANGICCQNGNGYYKLKNYNGTVYHQGGDFGPVEVVEFSVQGINLNAKVMLEGPFNGTEMFTFLKTYGYLPLSQPYNTAPWNYNGTEAVTSIPNDVVDWILFELRETAGGPSTATPDKIIARKAAFLLRTGAIVDLDGISLPGFNLNITDNLYLVVWHRNHLGVLSGNALTTTGRIYNYDFTTAASQAFGGANGHKYIGVNVWGMYAGDGDANGQIGNGDKVEVWRVQSGTSGYKAGDFNLNGSVDNQDKIERWNPNTGRSAQVPQ